MHVLVNKRWWWSPRMYWYINFERVRLEGEERRRGEVVHKEVEWREGESGRGGGGIEGEREGSGGQRGPSARRTNIPKHCDHNYLVSLGWGSV
eukprot:763837-Hanusia_phi.AAC.1